MWSIFVSFAQICSELFTAVQSDKVELDSKILVAVRSAYCTRFVTSISSVHARYYLLRLFHSLVKLYVDKMNDDCWLIQVCCLLLLLSEDLFQA